MENEKIGSDMSISSEVPDDCHAPVDKIMSWSYLDVAQNTTRLSLKFSYFFQQEEVNNDILIILFTIPYNTLFLNYLP